MLSSTLEAALNEQLGAELYSSHLYLGMSAYCESVNLPGAASWFRLQADEEREHGMKLFDYLVERSGRVALGPIAAPPAGFDSLLDAFQQALQHEREVTASIDRLYELAVAEGDHASQVFLQWFVQEQVEEEKQALDVVETLGKVGDSPVSLFMLDHELGSRRAGAD
jgi:ferritin